MAESDSTDRRAASTSGPSRTAGRPTGGGPMAAEWLSQTVDIPLWGVFVLTAYSARRLAAAASGLKRVRRSLGGTPDVSRDETGT